MNPLTKAAAEAAKKAAHSNVEVAAAGLKAGEA